MANYVPLSLQPIFFNSRPQVGAKIYVYNAGGNTPRECYSDNVSGALHSWPLLSDSNACIPAFWVGDGDIKIVITTANNQVIRSVDNIPIVSSSAGDGGGGDPTPATDIPAGFIMAAHMDGPVTGWVRANGKSIGKSGSGATERANNDCYDLFIKLYLEDANLSVTAGRGASADADWNAGKMLSLPDYRGRTLIGLDDMGSTAVNRLNGVTYSTGGSATTLGSTGGAATVTLSLSQMPVHSHTGTASAGGEHTHTNTVTSAGTHKHANANTATTGEHSHGITDSGHAHTENRFSGNTGFYSAGSFAAIGSGSNGLINTTSASTGITINNAGSHFHTVAMDDAGNHTHTVTIANSPTHTHTVTIANSGSGDAHNNMQPFALITYYIKL
jgi:microcystin-dependent protein